MSPAPPPKVPRRPPGTLTARPDDIVDHTGALWRISTTRGDHVLPWNGFRTFGPIATMRWDPHHQPPADQPGRGVTYAAADLVTVVAERFQKYRTVDPDTGDPFLFGWSCVRSLRLLDLTGDWPLRNGAAYALTTGPRSVCRAWAEAILDTWPDLDGLRCPSTMDGRVTVVLFEPAAAALPEDPAFARPLTQPDTFARVVAAADQVGYRVGRRRSDPTKQLRGAQWRWGSRPIL